MCKIISMKIKILKGKRWGMKKLAKNKEPWQFSQSWYIRNPSSMNELYAINPFEVDAK
jgi:hypothetical protein